MDNQKHSAWATNWHRSFPLDDIVDASVQRSSKNNSQFRSADDVFPPSAHRSRESFLVSSTGSKSRPTCPTPRRPKRNLQGEMHRSTYSAGKDTEDIQIDTVSEEIIDKGQVGVHTLKIIIKIEQRMLKEQTDECRSELGHLSLSLTVGLSDTFRGNSFLISSRNRWTSEYNRSKPRFNRADESLWKSRQTNRIWPSSL